MNVLDKVREQVVVNLHKKIHPTSPQGPATKQEELEAYQCYLRCLKRQMHTRILEASKDTENLWENNHVILNILPTIIKERSSFHSALTGHHRGIIQTYSKYLEDPKYPTKQGPLSVAALSIAHIIGMLTVIPSNILTHMPAVAAYAPATASHLFIGYPQLAQARAHFTQRHDMQDSDLQTDDLKTLENAYRDQLMKALSTNLYTDTTYLEHLEKSAAQLLWQQAAHLRNRYEELMQEAIDAPVATEKERLQILYESIISLEVDFHE